MHGDLYLQIKVLNFGFESAGYNPAVFLTTTQVLTPI